MPGGPQYPASAVPRNKDETFFDVFSASGANEDRTMMMGFKDVTIISGVESSWHLVFDAPETIPSGQAYLRLITRNVVNSGTLQMRIDVKVVPNGTNPATVAPTMIGPTTITFAGGDLFVEKETKISLGALVFPTPGTVHVTIVTEKNASTLASNTGHLASIVWE